MNKPVYRLKWLLDHDSTIESLPLVQDFPRMDFGLPANVGSGWLEKMELNDGIDLTHALHALEPSPRGGFIPQMNIDIDFGEAFFSAQIWTQGSSSFEEYWLGRQGPAVRIEAGANQAIFRQADRWHTQVSTAGGMTSAMHSLVLPERRLRSLIGEDESVVLTQMIGLTDLQPTVVQNVPARVNVNLCNAFAGPFTGAARKLYAQARILDYFAGLLHHFNVEAPVGRPSARHRKRIHNLHNFLMTLEGQLPTLTELAKDFGLSAKRMNDAFVAEYGQTIFAYVTHQRLDAAHLAVSQGHTPLKVLAARLGYSHVNHFISAFKRKFGYPPGSLRR